MAADRSMNWRRLLLAAVAIAMTTPVAAQEGGKRVPPPTPVAPPPAPRDPKIDAIVDDLIQKSQTPAAPAPAPKAPATATGDVVDDVVAAEKRRIAEERREGLLTYRQAMAAQQANRPIEALRLARKAKALYPSHAEIAAFTQKLQTEVSSNKLLSAGNTRAKAYLAAGLQRGQDLLRSGREPEGEDLLKGVVEAAKLFPELTAVDNYRRLAERDLRQHQTALKSGTVAPPADSSADQPALAAPMSEPPRNFKRLLRSAETYVPAWYAALKQQLTTRMSVDYRRTPVALVLDAVSDRTGIAFVLDNPITASRTHLNAHVDLRVGDVPAETILDLACQKSGLEYVLMQRSIVITTPAKALQYARQLPEALRHNWAVGRVLFPEIHPELFAAPPDSESAAASPVPPRQPLAMLEANLPAYLRSGQALVQHIQLLLQ